MDCMMRSREFMKNQRLMPLERSVVRVPMPTKAARNWPSMVPFLIFLLSIRSSSTVMICSGSFSPKVPEAKLAMVMSLVRSTGCGVMVDKSPVRAMAWKVPTPSRMMASAR